MRLAWAVASHAGLRRGHNEDSYAVRPDLGLFVVADGMGGHAAGEVASRAAVEAIEQFCAEAAAGGAPASGSEPPDPRLGTEANRLKVAFWMANRRLAALAGARPEWRGMATTAAAVLIGPQGAGVAHIGDSRVYRHRRGVLQRVTRDHSWVEEQVRAGVLTARAAEDHPWRHVVTRALAGGADLGVEVGELALERGDRLLLCSDGLFSVVPEARLAELLATAAPLAALCSRLVAEANAAGGPDNVTALLVDVDVR